MTGSDILIVILVYFLLLIAIAVITGRKSDNRTFFIGNKKSPWFLVAFGMIGASLSGVTFISVPGWVGTTQFSYMQIVFGYMIGYLVIALILMPIYYKLNVTSIYNYLLNRFGNYSYKTGAFFFLLSKIVGAGFRLFLVASVLQLFVFSAWGIPFFVTVAITILLILLYTFRGGIRTIVFTDALQTLFMLTALVLTIFLIGSELDLGFSGLVSTVENSDYSKIFFWDWKDDKFFFKQILAGAFIAMTMTGLDQDMMQKNLSIHTLKEAQKNIYWQMGLYIVVNIVFLSLGVLLYLFAAHKYTELTGQAPTLDPGSLYPGEAFKFLGDNAGLHYGDPNVGFRSDFLFPLIALKYLSPIVGAIFIIGLVAAAYSSADSALTALTTSFCVDFLNFERGKENVYVRYGVHVMFALILLITIVLFNLDKSGAVIDKVFRAAGYTYGPLLGLFAFGIFMKRKIRDRWAPIICIISPILIFLFAEYTEEVLRKVSWVLQMDYEQTFRGYKVGFELLILNGLLTFLGLLLISKKEKYDTEEIQAY